jgi:hypothetical protein
MSQRGFDNRGDVSDMNPVEHLPRLDDAAGGPCGQLRKLIAFRAVNSGKPEDVQSNSARCAECQPRLLHRWPDPRTLLSR